MRNKFRLDEIATVTMGQAPPGESYNSEQQGWPLIAGAGDFHNGKAKASKFTTRPSKISNTGDIILGIRASIGAKVISDREYCLGRGVAGIRPSDKINPSFLWHWLTHNTRNLAAKGKGATFKQVNRKDIGEMEIELPSLEAQALLSKAIDSVESAREARRRSIELLDELTQSIFLDMVGDPKTNPKKWEIRNLESLFERKPNYGTMTPASEKGEWLCLRVANIQNWEISLNDRKYVDLDSKSIDRHAVESGDLLLARAIATQDHLGKAIVAQPNEEKWAFDSHLMRIRLNKELTHPEFIRHLLRSPGGRQIFLKATRRSAVQFNINTKEISKLKIPVPPLNLQGEFVDKLKDVENIKRQHQTHLAHLDELFASVQQRAFDGTLWDDPAMTS